MLSVPSDPAEGCLPPGRYSVFPGEPYNVPGEYVPSWEFGYAEPIFVSKVTGN